jgi:hypothetical protein
VRLEPEQVDEQTDGAIEIGDDQLEDEEGTIATVECDRVCWRPGGTASSSPHSCSADGRIR